MDIRCKSHNQYNNNNNQSGKIYLAIRLWARDFYCVILDESAARVTYRELVEFH